MKTLDPSTMSRSPQEEGSSAQSKNSGTVTPSSMPNLKPAMAVYAIPELRAKVLQLLGPADLARFMRVHKDGMEAVARELYGSLRYKDVFIRLLGSTEVFLEREKPSVRHMIGLFADTQERKVLYASTVHTIDARQLMLSPAMIRDLGVDLRKISAPQEKARIAAWESTYNAEVFLVVVSALRKICPNARKILFGSKIAGWDKETWSVSLVPGPPAPGETQGHITHLGPTQYSPHDTPPKSIGRPLSPPDGYTMTSASSLIVNATKRAPPAQQSQQWLLTLREGTCFGIVGGTIYLGGLPATFDDLIAIQRHTVATVPVETISAPSLALWSFDGFRAFAGAFSALTTLYTCAPNDYAADTLKPSFAEFPQLFGIIRDSLPKLRSIRISVSGIQTAEATFLPLLRETPARDLPSLESIILLAPTYRGPIFNTLRWLAQQGENIEKVFINKIDSTVWDKSTQMEFARCLQRHLNTVDFPTLHVSHPDQISSLTYASDGRPARRSVVKSAHWLEQTQRDADHTRTEVFPTIETFMSELADAVEGFNNITAQASSEEILRDARSLHERAEENQRRMTEHFHNLLRRSSEMANDMGRFVDAMEDIVAQERG